MTAAFHVTLHCEQDTCAVTFENGGRYASEARIEARANGWTIVKGRAPNAYHDWCPDHRPPTPDEQAVEVDDEPGVREWDGRVDARPITEREFFDALSRIPGDRRLAPRHQHRGSVVIRYVG